MYDLPNLPKIFTTKVFFLMVFRKIRFSNKSMDDSRSIKVLKQAGVASVMPSYFLFQHFFHLDPHFMFKHYNLLVEAYSYIICDCSIRVIAILENMNQQYHPCIMLQKLAKMRLWQTIHLEVESKAFDCAQHALEVPYYDYSSTRTL